MELFSWYYCNIDRLEGILRHARIQDVIGELPDKMDRLAGMLLHDLMACFPKHIELAFLQSCCQFPCFAECDDPVGLAMNDDTRDIDGINIGLIHPSHLVIKGLKHVGRVT